MTDTLFPADAVSGAPVYSGRRIRQALAPLVAGATSARPLGGRSGVRPGTPSNTVTVAGGNWTCKPFAGVADLESAAEAGPYFFAFEANATGALNAQGAFVRVDTIYVQLDDPAEADGTAAPAVTRKYAPGVTASTPPTLPARSFAVAYIDVPVSGGGSPTVRWIAPNAVAAGGILPVTDLNELATVPPYYEGMWVDVASCDALFRSNGAAFVQMTAATFTSTSARDTEYAKAASAFRVAGARAVDSSTGYEWVHNGSAWKRGSVTSLQLDTSNSAPRVITQLGTGKLLGNNTIQASEAVTFPVPFASTPRVIISATGYRATGPYNDSGLSASTNWASAASKSTTGFLALQSITGGTLSNTLDYYYDWVAIGEV